MSSKFDGIKMPLIKIWALGISLFLALASIALPKKMGAVALVFSVVFALTAASLPARAGSVAGFGGASEITQIMNNAELAVQSMQSELQSVELVEHTYLQRLQQLKSTIGPYTAPFQKTLDSYQKVKAMHDNLSMLKGKTENLQGVLQNRFKEFAASNLTWDQWMAREQKLIREGNEIAITKIQTNQAALTGVKTSMEAYQKAANAMEATTGTHQATRMLGAQLTLLGGDVNRLITITAEANKAQALDAQEKIIDRERSRSEVDRIRGLQNALDKQRRAELETILKKGAR